ncbi:MAG: class I mannose-6-phosphate isomerase [Clostridia bacterium]|nr:class I mannose-6-phosphate isomerase [Clostridia bacterium]
MYPLLLKAPLKDYLWGGRRLIDEFGFEADSEKAAEAWMLSCHKDGSSVVRNGALAGLSLQEALEIWGKEALGEKAASFTYFPILIKLIDAKDRLSVQVHPDDEYAMSNEGEYGKTEMWYVVDCDEGAQLIYGFNQDISQGEFLERINNNNLSPVCNYVPVKKGDVFFIEAGTMHAIGKGILIAEVQQNSNTTYRVSDYGRLGADGKPRQLHIKQAVEVTRTEKPTRAYGNVGDVTLYPFGTVRELAKCEYFTTELIKLDGNVGVYDNDSFISLLILDGETTLSYTGGMMRLKKGDSVFLPAGLKVRLCGTAEILYSHL